MRKKTLEQKTADELAGLQIDFLSRLRNGNMSFEQADFWKNLPFDRRQELMGIKPKKQIYLKLISGSETLFLDECDGQNTIADSKGIFYSIDSDFKNYGANQKGVATPKIPVEVYEQVKDGKLSKIFGSLNSDLYKLCLTQAQILNFIKNHKNWLRLDGLATFFLFESCEKFFVANMRVDSDGLHACVRDFDFDIVWNAEFRHRFVLPQLEKLES